MTPESMRRLAVYLDCGSISGGDSHQWAVELRTHADALDERVPQKKRSVKTAAPIRKDYWSHLRRLFDERHRMRTGKSGGN